MANSSHDKVSNLQCVIAETFRLKGEGFRPGAWKNKNSSAINN